MRGLADVKQVGRFVGFDPNGSKERGRGVEFRAHLFDPIMDMTEIS